MAETTLSGLLDNFVEKTNGDKVTVGDLLDTLDNRSFGPLLLVPAIIALSPIGAIPGMSIVTGTWIILVAVQIFFTSHPWLPSRLLNFSFSRERMRSGISATLPWVKRFEKVLRQRYAFLTRSPADYLIALVSIVLAISFYPLALVPAGVAVPSAAITLLALSLTARDGLLAIFGFVSAAVAAGLTIYFWPF